MNKTFKKVFSVCCAVVTTLTATLFHSANLRADDRKQKIVFVGPSDTGKSNLVSRICYNNYNSDYRNTIEVSFGSTLHQTLWDLSGNRSYSINDRCFQDTNLCVLTISNKNQETEYFLNKIAENNVPNVVLCITKTDGDIPASKEVSSLLDKVQRELSNVNVFDEVLYTSAKNNTFEFCKPDEYTASNGSHIYNDETKEMVLADKLYELCGRKAADFEAATYEEETSYDENKTTTSKGKKYALGLGIPAALLPLILGIGYYEYDRHFRKQEKTKTKTTSEKAPKVDRTISS